MTKKCHRSTPVTFENDVSSLPQCPTTSIGAPVAHKTPLLRGVVASVFLLLLVSSSLLAGGSPEGVLLVVNPLSQASMTIANHYARLRSIPSDNIFYLPWDPQLQSTEGDVFRTRILLPILLHLRNHEMVDQIDCIVYSSDFPTVIYLNADKQKFLAEAQEDEVRRQAAAPGGQNGEKLKWPEAYTAAGSINGLTYLWQPVMSRVSSYFDFNSNYYVRPPETQRRGSTTSGFRSTRQYSPQGEVVLENGRRYYLSAMLGVTSGHGNSVDQVIAYLTRSAAADGTHPKGTIYFVKNNDVRSKVRDELYAVAAAELNQLHVAASVIEGTLPLGKKDVQGVVMGTAKFDWDASGSTILSGALCDNFTSFGGSMTEEYGQTLLTEFLRFGAAGANGTVIEPYAIAAKFPSPLVQVHYARGCTLAEAYYQSIRSPYQLLIVGDPLCRPWADRPNVSVSGVAENAVVKASLTLVPSATIAGKGTVSEFKLYVDAQQVSRCRPGGALTFDSTLVGDGYHSLRIVAIGPAPIESQGETIVPVVMDNHNRHVEATLVSPGPFAPETMIQLKVQSPGSTGIMAIQGSRIVGQVTGSKGQIDIPAKSLGSGPITLRVAGVGDGGNATNVMAKPLHFVVR